MTAKKNLRFSIKTSLLTGALVGAVSLGAGCPEQERPTVNPAPVQPELPATNAGTNNATNNATTGTTAAPSTTNTTTNGTTGDTTGAAKLPSKIDPPKPTPKPMCCVNPGPMRVDDGPKPTPITKPTSDKK